MPYFFKSSKHSNLGSHWIASLRSVIGPENSCHPFNQSDARFIAPSNLQIFNFSSLALGRIFSWF